MEWVETTGRDIDEAKEHALDELGVDEDDAEFEIIDEPKAGLFGLVRKEARVRARVRPTQPRPKVERRRGRGRSGGGSSGGRGQRDDAGAGSAATEATPASDRAAGEGVPEGRKASGDSRRKKSAAPRGAAKATGKRSTADNEKGEPMDEVTLDQQVEVIEDFLDGLLEAFSLDAEISAEDLGDDVVELRIEGEDLGLLIGPKGQTLAAVQELGRTVAQRRLAGPHQGRIRLDVAGYRKRRAEALTRFAQQVAEDVKETGVAKVLEPMSPPDRKVVHDALTDVEGVRTASEGEDNRRRVVVLPD